MKRSWKNLSLMLFAAVFILSFHTAVQAKPWIPDTVECTYQKENKDHNGIGLIIQEATKNVKVKKLKSSNTKVVKASWSKSSYDIININYYKTGKATITGDLYQGKKKITSFSIKVKVTKYVSPVKSFKLGSKDYASKLKNASQYYLTYKGSKKWKVSIKPASGWRLESMEFLNNKGIMKVIKNGTKITCKSNWHYVNAHFYQKKTGRSESVIIYIQK